MHTDAIGLRFQDFGQYFQKYVSAGSPSVIFEELNYMFAFVLLRKLSELHIINKGV